MRSFGSPSTTEAPREARSGDVVENPVSGERLTFLETSRDTGGAYTRVRFALPPRGKGTRAHLHTTLHERFEVVSGRLNVIIGRSRTPLVLGPGEAASVPPHVVHRFWNATDEETTFEAEVRPSGDFEAFMLASFGLAREGRTDRGGVPRNLLELGLLMSPADVYLPGLPVPAQRAVFRALASTALRLGYGPSFARYANPASSDKGGPIGEAAGAAGAVGRAFGSGTYGTPPRKIDGGAHGLATGVGWVSLGMGLALALAPRRSAALLGWGNRAALARAVGAADLVLGPALLLRRDRGRWMLARSLLNGVIAVIYARALATGTTPRKGRAVGGVVGMSVLTLTDYFLARRLRKSEGTPDGVGG